MVLAFSRFLIEKGPLPTRGTMASKVGSKRGEYDHNTYYGPEARKKHGDEWTLWTDHKKSGLNAGDNVKLSDVRSVNGEYHGVYHDDSGNEHHIPMSKFYKPLGGRRGKGQESAEEDQVSGIEQAIKKAKGDNPYIRVNVGGKFVNVAGVKRVDKDIARQQGWVGSKPKADIFLHDENNNPVSWHSLKAEGGFQQLGGVSDSKIEGKNHPIIQNSLSKFKDRKTKDGYKTMPEGLMYSDDLDEKDPEHRKIIHRAMYGRDHGRDYGINNVNTVIQGGINFTQSKSKDPEARKHGSIPSLDIDANQHVNTNDSKSDIIPTKIVVRKDRDTDQEGTGGRVMLISKNNHAYRHTMDINSSRGAAQDRQAQIEKQATEKQANREKRVAARVAAGKPVRPSRARNLNVIRQAAANRTQSAQPQQPSQPTIPPSREHGGVSFYSQSEM